MDETEIEATPAKSKAAGTWGVYPKSISRIETPKYAAWLVRIHYAGQYQRKTFNDNHYGGQEGALCEALKWRDETERQMGKPRTDRSVRKTTDRAQSVGVHRRTVKHLKRGRTYYRDIYEVTWPVAPGKVGRTTISVAKYGEEEALRQAQETRRAKERELFGEAIYDSPEASAS